ncbi:hypothetical protein FISHEDRAFT_32324 [Fistulina hepatica ATCC 64428]|uniref:SRR1-like domain-containing protein n=1 Tax=Fistulina hepatica ATCC 64428 TaxID=1128425 RepID=A0A0D7ARM8_9AGAR|nr:hypothetical protein FISHEDRAFT_32324 [Fistulina hepatica ATCC 64428]
MSIASTSHLKQHSEFVESSFSPLPGRVVCLGLGSPTVSSSARVQLAFLTSLCARFKINPSNVFLYDPIFSDQDCSLFLDLAYTVLSSGVILLQLSGVLSVDEPTILFMPHCDLELYEAVLRANWSVTRLRHLKFISNNFYDYSDNIPAQSLQKRAPCLAKVGHNMMHKLLPECESWPHAFNNTALQHITDPPQDWFDDNI